MDINGMFITRKRDGNGTTVSASDNYLFDDDPSEVMLGPRPPDDEENGEGICERGTVLPSERFYERDHNYLRSGIENPDVDDIDVDDLLTDFDLLDRYYNFIHRNHTKARDNLHPYVTWEDVYDMHVEILPLMMSFEDAERIDQQMFDTVYANEFMAKPFTKAQWAEFRRSLEISEEDDLTPLRNIISTDDLLKEYRYVPVGPRVFRTCYLFNFKTKAEKRVRVDVTERKRVEVAPEWVRELGIDFSDDGH